MVGGGVFGICIWVFGAEGEGTDESKKNIICSKKKTLTLRR